MTGWLVAGLGNPGPAYAGHRHNVGHRVVDELAERLGGSWRRHRTGRADAVETRLGPPGAEAPRVVLVRPRSYMNESGGPVAAVAAYADVRPEQVVVVHDELDLPFGTVRVKHGGGAAGHNGVRSVALALGTRDFLRVRVGVGRPPGRQDPADFVLSPYSAGERRELPFQVDLAADAALSLVERGLVVTRDRFHATTEGVGPENGDQRRGRRDVAHGGG